MYVLKSSRTSIVNNKIEKEMINLTYHCFKKPDLKEPFHNAPTRIKRFLVLIEVVVEIST